MLLRIFAIISFIFSVSSSVLYAYPSYITYGYQSCMSCHYNPHGNGPLTDYGRALGSVEIASQFFQEKPVDEDKLADKSGFLGRPFEQSWFRPSLSYRGLYLTRDAGGDTESDDWINMDASIGLVGKFLSRDRLIVALNLSYTPKPAALRDQSDVKEYRTREHYVGYRIDKEWGVYLGLMDKVFGIRVPDHIAYSRSITGLNQNDQTHGVLVHYASKNLEFGIQSFVGNLVQDDDIRQKGVTAMAEVPYGDRARFGASFLASSSDYTDILMYSLHNRMGFGEANSLLVELGEVKKKHEELQERSSVYLFTQNQIRILEGLWTLLSAEALQPDTSSQAHNLRIGPGIQYFPLARLELRADAYWTNRISDGGTQTDSWDLTAQIHLWL